jgi:transposase
LCSLQARDHHDDRNRTLSDAVVCSRKFESFGERKQRIAASSLGIWLYRELQPAGLPVIVVEARHMRVSLSTMRNKTDRNDARGIGRAF